ncbi:glycoside hydrolase family 78 protein [Guyanagaster necrorhizus]|uniref:Glycoside hydrolase family 78 protein n=1 Tax=Guyanagaster necrorhizus TaxID=856835 RepID=A0A9P7VYF7_9AGAR|nr:glycoside hydrolase family 78 protein [Guyanagaster necrorhizus MCA 3950]KAG7449503.1 glycoside hydrolase family 78 protein [Guyanagaster necrorhizus MCA 3950]
MFLCPFSGFCLLISCALYVAAVAPAGSWDAFNYAPRSRTVFPVQVVDSVGDVEVTVEDATNSMTLASQGSYIALDFLKEVGGLLSFTVDTASENTSLALSFSESPLFISPHQSDDSCNPSPLMNSDGAQILFLPAPSGKVMQTIAQQRGGFRYLTIATTSGDPVSISDVQVNITFMPHWDDLRAYSGYFLTEDPIFEDPDFLTKLWYSGAYTVQTNTIGPNQARSCPDTGGWNNSANAGPVSGPVLVDGAKRDRTVWPGDMGISTDTQRVSTNDLLPTRNSLTVMFSTQDPSTGSLQYSGPPINAHGSDTYISWSLIGAYNYFLHTGDLEFIRTIWTNYTYALDFLQSQVDNTGLMNVPSGFANDWGREGGQGHNSAANALLYRSLITAADLASELGDSSLSAAYLANASAVKSAFNELLWDSSAAMFRDNEITSLHPQDGNSLAVLYNITANASQNVAISEGLTSFWTPIGPLSPELSDTIIPFVGGLEVRAHFVAGQGERALNLLRQEWGYMLYTNISVQSTLLEGYTANGSLGYRGATGYNFDHAFTSHSHGWSTGPTSALTFFVLGLTLTGPQGSSWSVAPVLSGLQSAEGGFETSLGWFGVKWNVSSTNDFTLVIEAPLGTVGTVRPPSSADFTVDGESVSSTSMSDGHPAFRLEGGIHTLIQSL